ncbi:capsular polysaccharide biosynthesis protein [Rhizobium sp. KVB221]|uniref:Capsular polysaccharide biosynthesis protein n=1 Tax=Rhizobium setariae TaxID=2801340 RepID=A0A936YTA2_9HYPH|nr:capsular polysaccharide biosynthesis protein [Rhizobium setariae]MBL0372342.1 capsular polysaccharide biosynthesis protein [Rhizobium setariae]
MEFAEVRPRYAVTSWGLWELRSDLAVLLGAEILLWPFCSASSVDGFIGWGRRPSGLKAQRLAVAHAKPVLTFEDGFLKSYAPGRGDPAHSYIIDRKGIYFDAAGDNDLKDLIDETETTLAMTARSQAAIAFIRENRLSKYNNSPIRSLADAGMPYGKPYVLLVDQVAGDASISGAMAEDSTFGRMIEHARQHYPHAALAIRTHPAAKNSLLLEAARKLGVDFVTPGRMNPWPLIEEADAVYTVSSQLGFEALMAGKIVHCFGATYYSHRGLTQDYCALPSARKNASLVQVFHAAYIGYSSYLDLHERKPVEIEVALQQMQTVRDQRNRIERRVYTGGLSPWKRKALQPFIQGPAGTPIQVRNFGRAVDLARLHGGQIAVWGSGRALPDGIPAVRFEDGFIRSRGLGANLAFPCSLAMDDEHVYYDARGESRLERLIAAHEFPDALTLRARKLIDTIVARGVSKYNIGTDIEVPDVAPGRLRILIPGQVERDASIRFGSPQIRTNRELVAATRNLYPDAFLVYKEHPDVTSGLRSGGEVPTDADTIVREGDIKHWIDWCDRVETMTSLAGFEALIRGKQVGVHGVPFYAGWGLTDDRLDVPRRKRRVTVEMLAAATLILYPFYIHPLSAMPCTPEELVEEIARKRIVPVSGFTRLKHAIFQSINRTAVKIRDSRN